MNSQKRTTDLTLHLKTHLHKSVQGRTGEKKDLVASTEDMC